MTTDVALQQSDENFAPWADFKEWMDVAFARAVRAGTDAIHAADPRGLAGLEGAQIPGWGGYDYSRLGAAADVIEMYDSGNNVEIVRSMFPRLIVLTTSSAADPGQIHAIWHNLLLGGRGMILWDEQNAFVHDDGSPTDRGQTLYSLASELRSGVAAQLIASVPQTDPIAILYSPASFRTQWLLDRKKDGKPWADRQSETEGEDNAVRVTMRHAAQLANRLSLQPLWLTQQAIEGGALQRAAIRVLLMPHTIALSRAAAKQIRAFVGGKGIVIGDTEPGIFDAHSRRLPRPLLADLTASSGPIMLFPELQDALAPGDPAMVRMKQLLLEKAGLVQGFRLLHSDSVDPEHIDTRVFRNGSLRIIGLQREWSQAKVGTMRQVELLFDSPVYAYDLRRPGSPQRGSRIEVELDAISPALVAVAPGPLPEIIIKGPTRMKLGNVPEFTIATTASNPTNERVVHVEVCAPGNTITPIYMTNLSVHGTQTRWQLPAEIKGLSGVWNIRVTDVLTGQKINHHINVLDRMVPHRAS